MTLKLNLNGFQGYVKKTAAVLSDDPANPRIILLVEGTVKPLIEVLPEKSLYFQGLPDQITDKAVDFVGNSHPFHIQRIEDNLDRKATYRIETVEDGKHYRLTISNLLQRGNYRGSITLHTDLADKPELTVWVSASVEGEIGVRPNVLIVGRMSPDQPVLSGKVLVTDNRNKNFHILKCSYDEKLVRVKQESLLDQPGFSLEVTPNMQNIPVGGRFQTKLTIETDVSSEGKQEVQIQAINLAD